MPRMLMLLFAGCVVLEIVTLGMTVTRSSKVRTLTRSNVSAGTANTEAGTFWMDSARLLAVTTISSSCAGACAPSAGTPGASAAPAERQHPAIESATATPTRELRDIHSPLNSPGRGCTARRLLPVSLQCQDTRQEVL